MGVVYKARQKSLNRLVAIKILPPDRVGEPRFAERFAREAELLAQLSHPHIVTVHDFGETGGLFYIVMEFVDGVNLRDLLRDGKLEPKQALAIIPPICDALQFAHDKGIVHRDIKPENLLLDKEGRVKIADFGIAKLIEPVAAVCDRRTPADDDERRSQPEQSGDGQRQTAATMQAGTRGYSAPEQSGGPVDHRADIYALGVVLYEMLTGERPDKEVVAPSRKVQLDVRIDEIVLRALDKNPELRYQQVSDVKTMVETIVSDPGSARDSSAVSGEPAGNLPTQPGEAANSRGLESVWNELSAGARTNARELRTPPGTPTTTIYVAATLCFFALLMGLILRSPDSKIVVAIGAIGLMGSLYKLYQRGLWPFSLQIDENPPPADTLEQSNINKIEWFNPRNWSGGPKWLPAFYFSKRDSRVWVPKRIPAMGWTLNFARWQAVLWLVGIVFLLSLWPLATHCQVNKDQRAKIQNAPMEEKLKGRLAKETSTMDSSLKKRGNAFVDLLAAGNFRDATVQFADVMRTAMSEAKLAELWHQLETTGGKFLGADPAVRVERNAGFFCVYVPCRWERNRLDLKVVFDLAGNVSGLWIVPASGSDAANRPAAEAEKSSASSAQAWLSLVDGGKYVESWKSASGLFQGGVTEAAWINSMETFRKPLGNLISRKMASTRPVMEMPGAPDGQFVVMQFDSSFAGKKSAVETVTFLLDKDGQWKAAGYFIK